MLLCIKDSSNLLRKVIYQLLCLNSFVSVFHQFCLAHKDVNKFFKMNIIVREL